jgi:hypothetical protein
MLLHFRMPLLAAMCLFSSLSPAQQSGLGFKAGVTFSTLQSSAANYDFLGGYTFGVYSCRWLSDDWSLQPELLFTRLGAKRMVDAYTPVPIKLNYVRLPVLLKFHATDQWSLHAGMDMGLLIGNHQYVTEGAAPLSEGFNRLDPAFAIGTGMELQDRLDLNVRYTYGLMLVSKDANIGYPTNRSLQLTLSFRWITYVHRARSRSHHSKGGGGTTAHSKVKLW